MTWPFGLAWAPSQRVVVARKWRVVVALVVLVAQALPVTSVCSWSGTVCNLCNACWRCERDCSIPEKVVAQSLTGCYLCPACGACRVCELSNALCATRGATLMMLLALWMIWPVSRRVLFVAVVAVLCLEAPRFRVPEVPHSEHTLLVLVLAGGTAPRYAFERSIWQKVAAKARAFGVETYMIRAEASLKEGATTFNRQERLILSHGVDSEVPGCLQATVGALQFIRKHKLPGYNAPFLLRTNLSSFWIFERLVAWLKMQSPRSLYAGAIQQNNRSTFFASGSGFVLSFDLVDELLARQAELDYTAYDDVAVSRLFLGRRIRFMDRCDDFSYHLGTVNESEIAARCDVGTYHFRIKSLVDEKDLRAFEWLYRTFVGAEESLGFAGANGTILRNTTG
jgi:hypothetical protein